MECSHEFRGKDCTARICSSSNICPAVIGKAKCDEFDKFAQENPASAAMIISHAEVVSQLGG
ncbi:MAG: hypothetical protein WC349_00945 [Patescibacteria group bacterium]|jgi:hypothetical protein